MSERKKVLDEEAADGISGRIDYEEIKKLIDLLEERNLSLFELEVADFKIKVGRAIPQQPPSFQQFTVSAPAAPTARPQASSSQPSSSLEQAAAPGQAHSDNVHYVTSPMVGTMYRASSPASAPFVEVGETVKKGQTMCIIEAMKLMNEIEADIDGKVVEIMAENGKPVEYGQKLFAIEPQG